MDNTITFQQVFFVNEHKDELAELRERFMRISGTIIPNTLFQLRHWDMIEICMDLGDFVRNGDWSPTLVKKVNAFIDQVSEILASDEFKNDTKVVQLISKIQSKNLKQQQHESITKPQD